MRTCSLYGFIMAAALASMTLVLYLLGMHSDPARLAGAKRAVGLCGIAISVGCTALGVRARRAEVPEADGFGYGRALGAGVLISLVSSFLGAIFNYLYLEVINPGYVDVLFQEQMERLQAKGLTGAQLDQAEKLTRSFMTPLPMAVYALIAGFVSGVLVSLIVAAFLKRSAPAVSAGA